MSAFRYGNKRGDYEARITEAMHDERLIVTAEREPVYGIDAIVIGRRSRH